VEIETYRRLAQKNDVENYFLDKYIFRKVSIYLTILFVKLKITPNQTTFLSLLAALSSLYFLTLNDSFMLLLASALILIYYLLDHVDGELARYYVHTGTMQPSLRGHYFDVLVHRYSSNLMVFFLGLSIYNLYGYEWAVLLGFIACIGISSFPNVIAAQVLAGKIAREGEAALQDHALTEILMELEKKTQQVSDMQGSAIRKMRKILIEALFFPGHIILLVMVLMGDAFWGEGLLGAYPVNLRLLFLLALTLLYTAKTIFQSVLWIRKFKNIT
jgi:phosphatidylglycerophosphate synthase